MPPMQGCPTINLNACEYHIFKQYDIFEYVTCMMFIETQYISMCLSKLDSTDKYQYTRECIEMA